MVQRQHAVASWTDEDREAQTGLPALIRGLLRPEAYPHPADDLQLHETHISWVILAGPFAYKIRKPVNLGFVDFSGLAARAEDCHREVRLNRRLCPDVYLGVVQIVERDGHYALSDAGQPDGLFGPETPVEPVVWMRRLPADGMLPAMLARDAVTPELVREIARQLAAFHPQAATGPGVNEYGSLDTIRGNWDENFSQTEPCIGRTISQSMFDRIKTFVERFQEEQRPLLERRIAEGRIREGHGDLHAGSICVEGDRVHLFDCLEFTPRFRCADVAAEVAFLAMDLDRYQRPDLSRAFVEEYVQRSEDTELLTLLDFYRCYRAYVRGKVASLRLNQPGLSPEERATTEDEARSYFEMAGRYADHS